MLIRPLDPVTDLALVAAFYTAAPDYWLLAEGACDAQAKADEFFGEGPAWCDPALAHRLGLFEGGRLSGLAEVFYGFPEPQDAYLGLMVLGPWAQGAGTGRAFLAHVEALARGRNAPVLYLAVLDANPRGRAFWQREGFRPTGLDRVDPDTGHRIERLMKPLQMSTDPLKTDAP